jgi:Prenyltransferase and squalene oxidase repeat
MLVTLDEIQKIPGYNFWKTIILVVFITVLSQLVIGRPGLLNVNFLETAKGIAMIGILSSVGAVAFPFLHTLSPSWNSLLTTKWWAIYVPTLFVAIGTSCFVLIICLCFIATGGVRNSAFAALFTVSPFVLLTQPVNVRNVGPFSNVLADSVSSVSTLEQIVRAMVILCHSLPVLFVVLSITIGELLIYAGDVPAGDFKNIACHFMNYVSGKTECVSLKNLIADDSFRKEINSPWDFWHSKTYYFIFFSVFLITLARQFKIIGQAISDMYGFCAWKFQKFLLRRALNKAYMFIFSKQISSPSSWNDFYIIDPSREEGFPGESDTWVTAYVLNCLGKTPGFKQKIYQEKIQKAAEWLKQVERVDGGWGYNEKTRVDTDSTAIAINALAQLDISCDPKSISFICSLQGKDGGFATFPSRCTDDAWSETIVDVTPIAIRALSTVTINTDIKSRIEQAFEYLKNKQSGVLWNSFWWTSEVYATREVVTLIATKDKTKSAQIASDYLKGREVKISTSFETALLADIEGVSLHGRSSKYLKALLKQQQKDGSWSGGRNLMHTPPTIKTPWDQPDEKKKGIEDPKHIFSTATVIRTIQIAIQR